MRPRRSRRRPTSARFSRGSGLVLILVTVAVMGIAAATLVPNLVKKRTEQNAGNEERQIKRLTDGFAAFVVHTRIIPGTNDWAAAVAAETGCDATSVRQVFAQFPNDTNTRRVLLIDPAFTPVIASSALLYTQALAGIVATSTNAPGIGTRVMIISSSHRDLALPVGEGVASSANFSNLWYWTLNPATKAPPAGFPSAWSGQANHLHVGKINLGNLFHRVGFNNVQLKLGSVPVLPSGLSGLGSGLGNLTDTISYASATERFLLRGTHLKVSSLAGVPFVGHVVTRDCGFDLSVGAGPLFYFPFSETSGKVAANFGTLGAVANGRLRNGAVLNQAGPRPPTFAGFPSTNRAIKFDGKNDNVRSAKSLPATLPAFTMAGWINPTEKLHTQAAIFGQRNLLSLKSTSDTVLTLYTLNSGSLDVTWPFPINEWHHVAALGDGSGLKIYLDGVLATNKAQATANYGVVTSSYRFQIGGLGSTSTDYSAMLIDEVYLYDRALAVTEIAKLFSGNVP